jgi:glucosamine--fructose-6-phosphate aminotransferase (isomerizing)
MCGIFGVVNKEFSQKDAKILNRLFKLSESRGHDASGAAVLTDEEIQVYKRSVPASKLTKSKEYRDILSQKNIRAVIGHARMETSGSFSQNFNNQPVVKDRCVTIHNGIIVNDEKLWKKYKSIKREFQVDTEIINSLIRLYLKKGETLPHSVERSLEELKGSYSIGTFFEDFSKLLLATNTGSLYLYEKKGALVFASERYFLESVFGGEASIRQMLPGSTRLINLGADRIRKTHVLHEKRDAVLKAFTGNSRYEKEIKETIKSEYERNINKIENLRRCTKCILPETMPFIEFDKDGVCNYCRVYRKVDVLGKSEFEKLKGQKCIVTFSGGRDSSYALSYIKKVLKMDPVAYSYDWGMLTDLGRRNQVRMTGKLGVEHILISADIQKKRENIRKNVEAWLKHPDLGTVPLFMAGDKQYFYYASMLRKQMGINLVFLCENLLEKTDFKSGFCGIPPRSFGGEKFYFLSLGGTLRLFFYYAKQFIQNPAYINSSLLDSLWAFQSYYFIPHNFLSFYKYVRWEEKKVESTLKEYDWETDPETSTTWRIGDGTAAFYNYIYYTIAGFSENDTFRSNQVREGNLTRDEALEIAKRDNKPRSNSLMWYENTVGFDLLKAIKTINKVKKLYGCIWMKKKVISFVFNNFERDIRVLKENQTFVKYGYNAVVVATRGAGLKEKEIKDGINIQRLKVGFFGFLPIELFLYWIKSIAEFKNEKIFHCNDLYTLPIGWFIKKFLNKKVFVVYDCHEFETDAAVYEGKPHVKKLAQIVEKICIKSVDNVITVSDSIASVYQKMYGLSKPLVVMNCPRCKRYLPKDLFRKELRIPRDAKIFLYQGGFTKLKSKSAEIIAKIFNRLEEKNNAVIVFLGYGKYFDELKSRLGGLHVYFKNAVSVDTYMDYVCSADFGIHVLDDTCLNHEYALPNKVFEYIAAGLPLIVSNLSEMRKLVMENKIGLVLKNNSSHSLEEAVKKMTSVDRDKFKQNLRKAAKTYTWENQEKALINLYRDLLGR